VKYPLAACVRMDDRRDTAFELLAVLACAAAAAALFLVVSWSTLTTLLASALVVAVAAGVAWRSRTPFLVLGWGIACGAALAVMQGYLLARMFADFCIFEPCGPPVSRLDSLVAALPLALVAILLGAVGFAVVARAKRDQPPAI
jgi:hypothetical protein